MTTLEFKLDLPDRLAREVQAAGLLTQKALRELLTDAVRRRAGMALLAGAEKAARSGKPLSMKQIDAEVKSVRRARKASGAAR